MKYSPLEAAKLTIMQEISPNPHWGSSPHYLVGNFFQVLET